VKGKSMKHAELAILMAVCVGCSTIPDPAEEEMTMEVRRADGRVWLEGAKQLFHQHFEDSENGRTTPWAERSDTYMYLTQMRIAGWVVDYADLVTIAGYGPSFAYAPRPKDKWVAHYFPPAGRDERIAHATGCQYAWRQYADVEDYWQALKRAIDEGHAVHGPNEEDVLFIGYEDAEKPEDRKVMPLAIVFVDDDVWTWEQFKRWHSRDMVSGWFGRIEERVEPWPAWKSRLEVMKMMVRVASGNDSRRQPNDGVKWGIDGIEAYAADVADMTKSGAGEDDGGFFQSGWRGCHNIYPQMSGRPAAATYLKRIAPLFEESASRHILAAAAEYEKATKAWADFVGQLGRQRVADIDHTTAWTTPKFRKAGAAAIARAAAHERAAVSAIRDALMVARVNREGDRVWIDNVPPAKGKGNGYIRGIESLLAHAGTPVAYERLMGLSGMAFIAQADVEHRWEGKVDVGWWPLDPWGLQLRREFLGQAVGCELREVGWITLTSDEFVAMRDRLPEVYRAHIEPHVKESIEAGRPVLAMCDFGFVITGYDNASDQPPVLGRCACETESKQYRPENWPIGLLVLGARTEAMDPEAADVAALRFAVALARDRGGPYEAAWRDRRFTGQKAFAGWASLLRDTDQPIEDRHHANMKLNLRVNRTAAAAYLRNVADRHKGDAAETLRQAAASYEAVLEILSQISPHGLSVNPEARRDLAAMVDRIAALELQAAQDMERAVIHMTVRSDDQKVWIEGVEGFNAGEYASSVHGSQARILQTLGEQLSYDDLICYSGFAFRVEVHDEMCPSAGHPCCGFMCMDGSIRAFPWRTRIFESLPWSEPKENRAAFEAEARAAVKESIDRGIPVQYGSEEDGLIIGYAGEGSRWWCVHPYHKNGSEAFWHDEVKGFAGGKWPWAIVVWAEPKPGDERASDRDLTVAGLKQAVEMWNSQKRKAYFVGDAAYGHWLGWLGDVESGKVDDPKAGMQGNGWCFDVLIHSRRIAGRWLEEKADDFSDEAAKQLRIAGGHYGRIAELCMKDLDCSWDLALAPDRFDDWTSDMRQDQIARLEAAREHDRAAAAAIEKALATLK